MKRFELSATDLRILMQTGVFGVFEHVSEIGYRYSKEDKHVMASVVKSARLVSLVVHAYYEY